jgi:hypothetical protein
VTRARLASYGDLLAVAERREILQRLIESCGPPTGAWIAPDGRCYPCPDGGHHCLADIICEDLGLGGPRLDLDGPTSSPTATRPSA